jgi:hypothetical protein
LLACWLAGLRINKLTTSSHLQRNGKQLASRFAPTFVLQEDFGFKHESVVTLSKKAEIQSQKYNTFWGKVRISASEIGAESRACCIHFDMAFILSIMVPAVAAVPRSSLGQGWEGDPAGKQLLACKIARMGPTFTLESHAPSMQKPPNVITICQKQAYRVLRSHLRLQV